MTSFHDIVKACSEEGIVVSEVDRVGDLGCKEYDDFLVGMEQYPGGMPDAMVCSQESMRELEEQFGMASKLSCIGGGYAGQCLGVYVWIDNRFDQPLFIS